MTLKANFKFYLTDKLNSGDTSVTISNDVETDTAVELPTATSIIIRNPDKSDVIERITATATGGTLTTSARGLSNANPGVADSSREQDRRPGALCYVTLFPEDILEKDAADSASGDLTFSGDIIFTGSSKVPVYADATARDAAITSPANGMEVYNTADGKFQDYTGGAWVDRESGGTFANASETVAGKAEEATDAETAAGTGTGATGAQLFVPPDKLNTHLQTGAAIYAGASAAGNDTYAVTLTPAISSYTTGQRYRFKADVANTGAATLNINSVGAAAIVDRYGDSLTTGAIQANQLVEVRYDGTNFVYDNAAFSVVTDVLSEEALFGDGSDGDVTISANTTLTRDMFYNNLTIDNTYTLSPDGYRIFVKGTLTNNGTIARNGVAGGAGAAGSAGGAGGAAGTSLNAGTLGAQTDGGVGGAGANNGVGTAGTASSASNPSYSQNDGSDGGAGGAGSANAGGAAGTGGTTTRGSEYNTVWTLGQILSRLANPASFSFSTLDTLFNGQYANASSGGGGGGGGSSSGASTYGGGGGAGGTSGGLIWIAANTIDNTNGTISATGGAGGAGGAGEDDASEACGGGGGGGGGNGGVIYLIYKTLTAIGTTTLTAGSGGTGGAAGSAAGSVAGSNGTDGTAGDLIQITVNA